MPGAYREACDTLLENIPEKSPQGETSVNASGIGGDSELEFSEVAVKEPEDWRYLFEMPSVRSRTKQFLEMAARFNAKDVGFGGDYVCPGTMMILSDRWEGAERENVMRHELDHQFIFTLGQMMGNENERRRVQGLPHLSDDSLTSLKAKLAKINKKLDSLETFVSTPNGNLKLWGRNDIIEELQSVERDFGKKLKNREENR